MRTTINLDDAVLAEAKAVAAQSGRTVTAVIEDAVRVELLRRRRAAHRPPVELPTGALRVRPGVSLDSTAALLDLMEAPDDPV